MGKTLTVEYLSSSMPGRTVVLTAGIALANLAPVLRLTRSLTPSMVVLEDIDMIAEQRGTPFGHAGPLLFQLLNEMDGLQQGADVIFVLTTNRPDVLEPALAARPGRIDLAVELPLPDGPARRRLLELYATGLNLVDIDLDGIADQIDGATPAYIKELLREAAVSAAIEGHGNNVASQHLDMALSELAEGGRLAQRMLGFRPQGGEDLAAQDRIEPHTWPSGFPTLGSGEPTP